VQTVAPRIPEYGPATHAGGAPEHRFILGMRVDATSYPDTLRRVLDWGRRGESRYVCVATAHMAMEAYDSPIFRQAVNAADLVTPDGMPLVWGLRLFGVKQATRVYGPDLTPLLLEGAARMRLRVGFYGGTPRALDRMIEIVTRQCPGLEVAFANSPPFRPATPEEDRAADHQIVQSGTRILFVGLGCPKQERWMAERAGRLPVVMVGVGAAFDFISGLKPQAPRWMQNAGLEWLFRLCSEPQRLWRRYLQHGPRFVVLFFLQWIGVWRPSSAKI